MAAEELKKPGLRPTWRPRKVRKTGVPAGEDKGRLVDTTGMMDLPFLVLTLLLVAIGLLMLYSASYPRARYDTGSPAFYFVRQAGFAAAGILAMLLVSRLNYFIFHRASLVILVISLLLLALVLLMPGSAGEAKGAKRWIILFGQRFQPSEIAKLAVILSFASMMSVWKDKMDTFKYGVLPYVGVLAIISALLFFEPHFSATLIIILLGAIMMFFGGTKLRWFGIGLLAVALVAAVFLSVNSYMMGRVTAWMDPQSDTQDSAYQGIQAQNAIGSGGVLGLGFGHSRQKYLYMPEEKNDYIFAIVCEELGLIGAIGIILLFALLIVRGYWIAMHARDRFGTLTAAGLTTLLAVQVLLNLAVVTGLSPSTGISLPFFSYGGTALLMQLGEMGIILSISRWCVNKESRREKAQ